MAPPKTDNVLLTAVVPALGAVVSLVMYASPFPAVYKAYQARALGDINPIPFAVTVANTVIWCTYGLVKKDPYVTSPNALGVVVALFCALACHGIAEDTIKTRIMSILCFEGGVLAFLGVLTSFAAQSQDGRVAIWGLAGNVISVVYYTAPLSTMAEVVRTRNSASILLPMTVMNVTNAGLWTTYGIAVWDVYIWLPNGVGLLLSLLLVSLKCCFPRRPATKPSSGTLSQQGNALLHDGPYSRMSHVADEERGPVARPTNTSSSGRATMQ